MDTRVKNVAIPLTTAQKISILQSLFAPVQDQKGIFTLGSAGKTGILFGTLPTTPADFFAIARVLKPSERTTIIHEVERHFPMAALFHRFHLLSGLSLADQREEVDAIITKIHDVAHELNNIYKDTGIKMTGSTEAEFSEFMHEAHYLDQLCAQKKAQLASVPYTPASRSSSEAEVKSPNRAYGFFKFSDEHIARSAASQRATKPTLGS